MMITRMAAGIGDGGEKVVDWPVDRVRKTFIDYFVDKQVGIHTYIHH